MILQPKVLILDEPTSNLDIQGSKILIEIIKKIKDKGISIVISEHRIDSFKEVADRFLYINEGKLDEIWTSKQFENLSDEKLLSLGLRPKTVEKVQIMKLKTIMYHYWIFNLCRFIIKKQIQVLII